MLAIKIRCRCGQKYLFDVEPVNGRMHYAVFCPVCGLDGTETANHLIAEQLAAQGGSGPALRLDCREPEPTVVPALPRDLRTTSRTRPASAPRRWNKWALVAVGCVLILIAGGAAFGLRILSENRTRATITAYAADGLPHSAAELNAWYTEPATGQNAATVFSQGFDVMAIGNSSGSTLPLLGNGKVPALGVSLSPNTKASLSSFLHANKGALQLFAEGAKLEQSRYPVDLSLGVETPLPHLGKLRSAAKMLALSAMLHADSNNGPAAANEVLVALAVVRSIEAEPALFSQQVRAISMSTVLAALEQTVNRSTLKSESLAALATRFQRAENWDAGGDGFTRGLVAERASSLALLHSPQKIIEIVSSPGFEVPASQRDAIVARLQKKDKLTDEEAFLENAYRQLLSARKEPLPARLKLDDMIREASAQAGRKNLPISQWMLSGLAGRPSKEACSLASSRLAVVAIALEQFRAAHENRYPQALAELTPAHLAALPADPFDGQPLHYKTKSSGYTLYSIGPDLKDDGGERKGEKGGDIVFEVIAPAKPALP
jgi:hypothetical protein